jgi:hypothetical protein
MHACAYVNTLCTSSCMACMRSIRGSIRSIPSAVPGSHAGLWSHGPAGRTAHATGHDRGRSMIAGGRPAASIGVHATELFQHAFHARYDQFGLHISAEPTPIKGLTTDGAHREILISCRNTENCFSRQCCCLL